MCNYTQYDSLPASDQVQYRPYFEKFVNLGNNTKCVFNGNCIYLRVSSLSKHPSEERKSFIYSAIDKMVSYGILESDSRNINDFWRIYNYEFNIIFKGIIGKLIINDLKKAFKKNLKTTVYFEGKSSNAGVLTKFYNMTALESGKSTNLSIDSYKLELTIRNKNNKLERDISKYNTFPEITQMYKKTIKKSFNKFYKLLDPYTQHQIKLELSVKKDSEVVDKLLSKELSFTHIAE